MDFFDEVALAERQRPAAPSSTMPIQAPDQLVALLDSEPLSGLFGSLPVVADSSGTTPSLTVLVPAEPADERADTPHQEALAAGTGLPAGSPDSSACDLPDAMAVHIADALPPVSTLALSTEPGDGMPEPRRESRRLVGMSQTGTADSTS